MVNCPMPSDPPATQPGQAPGRTIESTALMAGAREVMIIHRSDVYRLRLTANDKLILTK
jgi:hemin uptake protein HemP